MITIDGNGTGTQESNQDSPLYVIAEKKLHELVEAGNIEAIRLALSRNPTQETIC